MSSEYQKLLKDPRWQKKRLSIMNRDGWACRDCSKSHQELQVHHCRYSGLPWEAEDIFLLTLCGGCHEDRQALERGAVDALRLIFAQSSQAKLASFATFLSGVAKKDLELTTEYLWAGEHEFMSQTRWIQYGKGNPAARPHVEAVLGKIIDWSAP